MLTKPQLKLPCFYKKHVKNTTTMFFSCTWKHSVQHMQWVIQSVCICSGWGWQGLGKHTREVQLQWDATPILFTWELVVWFHKLDSFNMTGRREQVPMGLTGDYFTHNGKWNRFKWKPIGWLQNNSNQYWYGMQPWHKHFISMTHYVFVHNVYKCFTKWCSALLLQLMQNLDLFTSVNYSNRPIHFLAQTI